MGRSVSRPSDCHTVVYKALEDHDFAYDDLVEDIQNYLPTKYKSLSPVKNMWLGREDRVLLENAFCYIGISEYMGLCAIWLKEKEDANIKNKNLSSKFLNYVGDFLENTYGEYRKLATFSNGEAVFERIQKGE